MNIQAQSPQRMSSLDLLRGIALLGILLMNMQSFAMPGAVYLNPTAFGDLTGINWYLWSFYHIFADQKFMSLFSMLFGAGVLLFCQNVENKGRSPAGLHYRRTFWLLVFGLIHGYLFWYGDILFSYAMCGFLIYLLRNKSIKTLLWISVVLLLISSLYSLFMGFSLPHFPDEALTGLREAWSPEEDKLQEEIAAYTGTFGQALHFRVEETFFMQTYVFLTYFIWRATAMMLLGMALFKSGFFHLTWSKRAYQKLFFISMPLGLSLIIWGLLQNSQQAFSLEFSMFVGSQFNYWGSILVALGYAALVMLWANSDRLQALQQRLKAIGKTAFSNYILHTLICTTIFYGYGMGVFAELERLSQLIIIFAIWMLQLWLSPLWLRHYKFGPLEWCWRSLTYWRWQPMASQNK
ncbi:MAG: DUF418 domain-containing protein [Alteromonadaceae bacterium]|nr:DUF418 domain-containing protein [Alteromonadaceae bacterium]